ncbi:hypothetical protein ABIE26_001348 [Pedobacter africanus]|uniref:Uncharacterized protein n=1 Tax=Pedobacter africanus TaxID=151894 RepID=A0ACC6KSQ4_9SPHI|nr:hypothetical protein [Pedobacter africanus]
MIMITDKVTKLINADICLVFKIINAANITLEFDKALSNVRNCEFVNKIYKNANR